MEARRGDMAEEEPEGPGVAPEQLKERKRQDLGEDAV